MRQVFAILSIVTILAGCEEPPVEAPERIRAIKSYTVVEPATGMMRRYSGTIASANTSILSFAVPGTVETVSVNQGDRVAAGQVIATLDSQPFELDVRAAQSELSSAQANYTEAQLQLERQKQLFEKGWVAQAALDTAEASFDAAQGQLNVARSRLGLAQRDLAKAKLVAPFAGVIVKRDVEPFTEVKAGEVLFQIDSEGTFEVNLSVPDVVVGRLSVGTPVTVDAATANGCGCSGRITEIGVLSGAANAVPVTAAITAAPAGLIPGMSVEVGILLAEERGESGFLIPLVAIAPGEAETSGYVFKYDPETGTVKKTAVTGSEAVVSGNLVGISSGVSAGDIIASAGVSFLRDGQQVTLLGE